MKKLISMIILLSMLVLTACSGIGNVADTTEHETNDDTTKSEAPDTTNEEKEPEPEPEPEPGPGDKNYKIVFESSFTDEDIQPAYDRVTGELCSLGVWFVCEDGNRISIVDDTGKVVADVSSCIGKGYSEIDYCSICGLITNHESYVDPITMELKADKALGHGGYSPDLFYDETTGEIFTYNITPEVQTDVEFAVVTLARRREPTQDEVEWFGCTYGYDLLHERNGIVVDGKLVVPCEYDGCIQYRNDVCALRKNGKWGYFNKEGKQILGLDYDPSSIKDWTGEIPYQASYGYIALCKDGKWAYATTAGELVTDFEFEEARPAFDRSAWVKRDGKWCVISFTCDNPGFVTVSEAEAERIVNEMYTDEAYDSVTVTNLHMKKSFYGAEGYAFSITRVFSGHANTFGCIVTPEGSIFSSNELK